MLNILIIVARMPRMMNNSRILSNKSTRIIQTFKSIFIVSDTISISRFGFVHVF